MIKISTQFDAGSVVVKDLTDPANIRLALRPDVVQINMFHSHTM